MSRLYEAAQTLRSANVALAQGRVWDAYETYTEVLESEARGHPFAFLNRALCLILLGHPALATFDCWRAISAGKWAKNNVRNHLGLCIRTYVAMYAGAKAEGDAWTTGCANGEVVGEKDRWLAQTLADLAVRTAEKPKSPMSDFPHARYVILCGYYRLAYALFKCGGGALQSALNMINLATEHHCATDMQRRYFLDLQNHILEHIQGIFKEEDEYMVELHNKGLIQLPRDRPMMENNLMRGLMRSTFTTIFREQYPWDAHSITTENFDELRPGLEQFVQESVPDIRLAAIRSSDKHAVIRYKVPRLYLEANAVEGVKFPLAFVDENGFFVWSRKNGVDVSCEGCGALLLVDGDWIPPPDARQQTPDNFSESNVSSDIQTSDENSAPGDTMPPVEHEEDRGTVMSPPPKHPTGRYYANLNAKSSGAPRPDEGLTSHPVLESDIQNEVIPDSPESETEEHVTSEPGRSAFETERPSLESPGSPEAGKDASEDLEEERKDSLYPNVDDDAPVCPSSPRPAPQVPSSPPPKRSSPAPVQQFDGSEDPQDLQDLPIRKLRERVKESGQGVESDLRVCLGQDCCVFFCSKECEDKHAPSHDMICDLGLEDSLPTIEAEQFTKVGGWWGGMVPTIPRQRVLALLMKKVMTSLWLETECADFDNADEEGGQGALFAKEPRIPLQIPWVRLMDGNLDEPVPIPDYNSEQGDVHFVNDMPDGDLRFLFPGYKSGTARPSPTDLAQFKSHKLPFSLDTSVIWPLQVLYEMGNMGAFFDVRRWDGWMLTTLTAKIEASARIDHFCRFTKSIDAGGMISNTRCVDLPHAVRTNGLQRLQKTGPTEATPDSFTDPNLANETELLEGSLHPLSSLIRAAEEVNGQPTVRLGERAGDLFVFNWPIGSSLAQGAPLLTANDEVWPFKLLRDQLENDEHAGIGGRWANVRSKTVERWIRKGYQASREDDMEWQVVEDSGLMIEEILAGYRRAAMGVRRRGAARDPPIQEPSGDEDKDGHGGSVGGGRDDVLLEVDNAPGPDFSSAQQLPFRFPRMIDPDDGIGFGTFDTFNPIDDDGPVVPNRRTRFDEIAAPPIQPPPEAHPDSPSAGSDDSYWSDDEGEHFVRDENDLIFINGRLWSYLHALTKEEEQEEEQENESESESESESKSESEHEQEYEHERKEHQHGYQDGGLGEEEKEDEEEAPRSYRRDDEGDSDGDEDEGRPFLKSSSEGGDISEDEGEEKKQDGGEQVRRGTQRAPIGSVVFHPPAPSP